MHVSAHLGAFVYLSVLMLQQYAPLSLGVCNSFLLHGIYVPP